MKSKFTEAPITFLLKQVDEGTAVAEVCREAGIPDATFYNWHERYAVRRRRGRCVRPRRRTPS